VERKFSLEEAKQAKEAFITSATSIVMPVIRIDDRDIGDGQPGPVARKLRSRFHKFAESAH
jgi:D-alanine transaminase